MPPYVAVSCAGPAWYHNQADTTTDGIVEFHASWLAIVPGNGSISVEETPTQHVDRSSDRTGGLGEGKLYVTVGG